MRQKGQRRLDFSSGPEPDIFKPIFPNLPKTTRKKSIDLEPGRLGSTRNFGQFPADHPKLVDFRCYLQSVDGHSKGDSTAREISIDVSKILWYVDSTEVKWNSLLNLKCLLEYFELLRDLNIKSTGRCTKMERCGDALRYMRFILRSKQHEVERTGANVDRFTHMFSRITEVEERLAGWKTTLRREKKRADVHRLEKESNELPLLDSLNNFMSSTDLQDIFRSLVTKAEKGEHLTDDDLRIAMGAVCIPVMLASSKRPGVVCNCTQTEFDSGRMVRGDSDDDIRECVSTLYVGLTPKQNGPQ